MARLKKDINVQIHNFFEIEVMDVVTKKIRQKAVAYNVILDSYYTALCNVIGGAGLNTGLLNSIAVGSGTGTPSHTDSGLFNRISYKDSSENVFTFGKDVASKRMKIVYGTTELVGSNITEVGLSQGSTVYTHAMLQDMNGNVISIQKTDTDIITIYGTYYVHTTSNQKITAFGTNQTHTSSAFSIMGALIGIGGSYTTYGNVYNGMIKAGIGAFSKSVNTSTLTVTMTSRIDVSQGNIKGISAISFQSKGNGGYPEFMTELAWTPYQITGESVGEGDGVQTQFNTKFDFPYNATVYVNGVAQNSGVTIKKMPCDYVQKLQNCRYFAKIFEDYSSDDTHWVLDPYLDERYNTYVYDQRLQYADQIFINYGKDYGEGPASWTGSYSDDLEHWTSISGATTDATRRHKYFKTGGDMRNANCSYDGYNIVFDNPPANGDVITVDYTTDYMPKDSDHVIDVQFTLHLGEYQGE